MKKSTLSRRALPVLTCGLGIAAFTHAQTPLYTFNGPGQYDRLGASISSAGDVNLDGKPDILVGAPEDFQVFFSGSGFARVYDGATGDLLYTIPGEATYDQFGFSVGMVGDVNNDGRSDMIIGGPSSSITSSLEGMARVVSGQNGATIFTVRGQGSNWRLGHSVSGAGDVNGDGKPDFIVGAPEASVNGNNSGLARVYSGATGLMLWQVTGSAANKRRGYSVSMVGDVNGDGNSDVIVGSLFDGARVYSGLNGNVIHIFNGPAADIYGKTVGSVADVNGDGVRDLIIAATQEDVFSPGPGYVQVRSGATGVLLWTAFGIAIGDRFGSSVAEAGDWNADGTPDIIVGADPSNGSSPSYARILSGVNGAVLATLTSANPDDDFGFAVAGLGDTTGNTKVKVGIGAPLGSPNGIGSGYAKVFEGAEGGAGGGCGFITNYCSTSPNTVGSGAVMSALGSTTISENDFFLRATGCPANTNGIFYYGPNQIQIPFGDGFRCVGGGGNAVYRFPVQVTNGSGTATRFIDYGSLPIGGDILPGSIWNFQFWYRDPMGATSTFNLSDGLSAEFCP